MSVIYWLEVGVLQEGLYGSCFGIIAGSIGIRLSHANLVHQMISYWTAFVILVCVKAA